MNNVTTIIFCAIASSVACMADSKDDFRGIPLGIMSHMWQDYYAHGVEKNDSWFGATIGDIKGSPDDIQMEPVSYGAVGFRGGHGGVFRLINPFSRVQPGDRADDSDTRRKQAQQFTEGKFIKYLTKWRNGCCCAKEWKKRGKK